jgi:hypothetical protein
MVDEMKKVVKPSLDEIRYGIQLYLLDAGFILHNAIGPGDGNGTVFLHGSMRSATYSDAFQGSSECHRFCPCMLCHHVLLA